MHADRRKVTVCSKKAVLCRLRREVSQKPKVPTLSSLIPSLQNCCIETVVS